MNVKLSKKQIEILALLNDKSWVYISLFRDQKDELLAMEKYGLIQVKGRDKYDFDLWGQARRTLKGRAYLKKIELMDTALYDEESKVEKLKPRKSQKKPKRSQKKPKITLAADDYALADEELTLEEITRIEDPTIRRKLLNQWNREHSMVSRTRKNRNTSPNIDEDLEQDAWEVEMQHEYD
ncbi:MAG: hypothetical protein ACFFCZ_19615 [Promethearchaeota archaeon]